MQQLDEETREFLIESNENLATLDREIVELEQRPDDIGLISSVFRTIHTIKGTCGFFGFDILGSLTHVTENVLGQVRERQRPFTPELISLVLESVDEVKSLLAQIEETGAEGEDRTAALRKRLEASYERCLQGGAEVSAMTKTKTAISLPVVSASEEEALLVEAGPALPGLSESNANDFMEATPESAKDFQIAESTIRVDVGLLNRLMNLVGELVLARNQLLQDTSTERSSLQQTSQRLNLITSELQEGVMKTRMQSVGSVWNKLPRVVRDLAARCGKRVRIEMEGANTELDKTVLEAIKDPLTHVVRNACDHGIETPEIRLALGKSPEGLLRMRAYHEGGVVNIEVSDDGCGIDPEKVKRKAVEKGLLRQEQAAQLGVQEALHLIFLPGFSTAPKVTSISGRGVGMDVVKTNIEKIGGSVTVMNRPEGGTTIRIKIPLTLAIIPGLLVTVQRIAVVGSRSEQFIIPQVNLLELVRLEGAEELMRIQQVHSASVFRHRGKLLPLIYLGHVLGCHQRPASGDVVNIVILQAENRQIGLVVDSINETQEIVVKPLGRQLKALSFYLGATIMGDGKPALILDVAGLARQAGLPLQVKQSSQLAGGDVSSQHDSQMMLLFRAGDHKRLTVRLEQVNRIEKVSAGAIEMAAGMHVLNYRGNILPLVTVPPLTGAVKGAGPIRSDHTHVVVFRNAEASFGLVVDEVIDILSETVTLRRITTSPGLAGSTLMEGKVTDLVDVQALAALAGVAWPEGARADLMDIATMVLEEAA